MIDRFDRIQPSSRKSDIRRIAVLAVVVAAIGVIGHFARPAVIRFAARKSLGLWPRQELIRDALNGIYPAVSEGPGDWNVRSLWAPSAGFATWQIDPTMEYGGGRRVYRVKRHAFVDGRLDRRGLVRARFPLADFVGAPYGDRNGRLVVAFRYDVTPEGPLRIDGICVIRIGSDANEVVGIVVPSRFPAVWGGPVYWGWRDEDGDGALDFVLLTLKNPMGPKSVTAQTLAVFRWDDEQTALHMMRVPSDGSVRYWTPPDGQPYEFPQTAVIDDICRELLPLPNTFGQPPTRPPATQSSRAAP